MLPPYAQSRDFISLARGNIIRLGTGVYGRPDVQTRRTHFDQRGRSTRSCARWKAPESVSLIISTRWSIEPVMFG
jgi:hypothetical protein